MNGLHGEFDATAGRERSWDHKCPGGKKVHSHFRWQRCVSSIFVGNVPAQQPGAHFFASPSPAQGSRRDFGVSEGASERQRRELDKPATRGMRQPAGKVRELRVARENIRQLVDQRVDVILMRTMRGSTVTVHPLELSTHVTDLGLEIRFAEVLPADRYNRSRRPSERPLLTHSSAQPFPEFPRILRTIKWISAFASLRKPFASSLSSAGLQGILAYSGPLHRRLRRRECRWSAGRRGAQTDRRANLPQLVEPNPPFAQSPARERPQRAMAVTGTCSMIHEGYAIMAHGSWSAASLAKARWRQLKCLLPAREACLAATGGPMTATEVSLRSSRFLSDSPGNSLTTVGIRSTV